MSDDADLSTLHVHPIRGDEHDRWQRMMLEKHSLQSKQMVGEPIRYVAVGADGVWLAYLDWSSVCSHLSGPRAAARLVERAARDAAALGDE
jgi:hypothetical protein